MPVAKVWAAAGERPRRKLFRVQHNKSANNSTLCGGFSAGRPRPPRGRRQYRAALRDHLLNRRRLSPFISVVDNAELAAKRAAWMQNKGFSGVRIYVINPRAVGNKALNVWKAAKDLKFYIPRRVNGYTVGERVYMTVIPGKAVGKEYTSVREFRESFGEYETPGGGGGWLSLIWCRS